MADDASILYAVVRGASYESFLFIFISLFISFLLFDYLYTIDNIHAIGQIVALHTLASDGIDSGGTFGGYLTDVLDVGSGAVYVDKSELLLLLAAEDHVEPSTIWLDIMVYGSVYQIALAHHV